MKLTVLIPVYNEYNTIREILTRVQDTGLVSEILLVDDGSTDGTREILKEMEEGENIRVIYHEKNQGKGAAVRLGMACASGDIIIVQDADLELDPSEYTRLIAPIVAGQWDVVYGSRFLAKSRGIPLRTRLANRFLTMLTNVLYGAQLTDMETAYKAFRREVIEGLCLRCVRFDFEPEITAKLLLVGYQIHEVPIGYTPRTREEGKKISVIDGIEAIHTLFRCRFLE